MSEKKIHLLCNAHLDPVWLWQRAEGMGEALSTFRIAADFCERYDNFIFNHNEALLYEWVLENEPELFERIKKLVKAGKWKIMGGWYLQPDVVMPSGESIVRQIRVGNEFFKKHFGYVPKTSINFDSFGHSKGLVQIVKKSGYDNYAFLRPRELDCKPFIWKGFDGSELKAYKMYEWYNTPKGEGLARIEQYIKDFPDREINMVTWGIGNHGGGPSEKDLNDINNFIALQDDFEIVHSDYDTYFSELDESKLETIDSSLVHCMVGCYTSMVRVKQGHRNLENKLNMCEKMLSQSGVEYNEEMLNEAEKALLFSEFHDVLPGSAVKKVEDDSLNLMGFGCEITDRLMSKAFFKLCRGQEKAKTDEIPVLIYNPHPYEIEGNFEVEFQLAEQNHPSNGIYQVKVRNKANEYIPSQLEQEDSAHGMDWRKKVVFNTVLKPMGITRLDCELELKKNVENIKSYTENDDEIVLENKYSKVTISKETGLIKSLISDGKNVLNSMKIKVFSDNADPWGMLVDEFSDCIGEFEINGAVRVIESGAVRTKVQSDFKWNKSYAVVTYTFSQNNKFIDVDVRMLTNDENIMVKLCFDTALNKNSKALGQTMFGTEELRKEGKEAVFQKWCGLSDENSRFYIINSGTYGGSFEENEIRISLLRTAVYAAHPVDDVEFVPDTRIYNHIDMGERFFSFRLLADEEFIDYEAEKFNQKPYVLSLFPSGSGELPKDGAEIDNKNILLSAFRKTDKGMLIRLYNSKDCEQKCKLFYDGAENEICFGKFEVKTFIKIGDKLTETNMLGE